MHCSSEIITLLKGLGWKILQTTDRHQVAKHFTELRSMRTPYKSVANIFKRNDENETAVLYSAIDRGPWRGVIAIGKKILHYLKHVVILESRGSTTALLILRMPRNFDQMEDAWMQIEYFATFETICYRIFDLNQVVELRG